jgi:molybdopterin molybdotransferase
MITVQQAEQLILENTRDYGAEIVLFDEALGRVLAENIKADRDLPAFNRVTMDGIASFMKLSKKALQHSI